MNEPKITKLSLEQEAIITIAKNAWIEIGLNTEQRLHTIGKPAVIFENYNLYYYHGKEIPEKYGQDWQVKWLVISPRLYIKNILVKETKIDEQELERKMELEKEMIFTKVQGYKNKYETATYSTDIV
jgi:hypothetical protein